MKRQAWIASSLVLAFCAAAALLLFRARAGQVLEAPGLRLSDTRLFDESGETVCTNSVFLPKYAPGFRSELMPVTRAELDWLPPDTTYGRRAYEAADGFRCQVSIVLMGTDRTSIHKPQYCLVGQGFHIDSQNEVALPITEPVPYQIPAMKVLTSRSVKDENGREFTVRGIFVYWFVCEDALTAQHWQRMWWMARDLIAQGRLQRWAYVSYFTVCLPGREEAAFERMQRLIAETVPEFQKTTGRESAVQTATTTAMPGS